MRTPTLLSILCGVVLLALRPAPGSVPAELVAADLRPEAINLTDFDGQTLTFFGENRQLRTESVQDVVQLRFPPTSSEADALLDMQDDDEASAEWSMIGLTDGQRLVGRIVAPMQDGQSLLWEHPTLGRFTISLDAVRWIHRESVPPVDAPAGQDIVELANGDTLKGFVSGWNVEGVSIIPSGADQPVVLGTDRWTLLRLGNPAEAPTARAFLVHLTDGSSLLVNRPRLVEQKTFELELATALPNRPASEANSRSVQLALEQVRHIDCLLSGMRLIELAELPMQRVSGGDVFGQAWPQGFDQSDLRLHAPVRYAFDLPAGAHRFAALARLDGAYASSESLRIWADCELLIQTAEDEPVERFHLTGESLQEVEINLPVASQRMTIEVDPGKHGPILDRVKLLRPVILLREQRVE